MINNLVDDYRDYRATKKKQHEKWFQINTRILKESRTPFTEHDTVYLFRVDGKPSVDFYPHTGRWKKNTGSGKKKMFRGGAKAFLNWYERQ